VVVNIIRAPVEPSSDRTKTLPLISISGTGNSFLQIYRGHISEPRKTIQTCAPVSQHAVAGAQNLVERDCKSCCSGRDCLRNAVGMQNTVLSQATLAQLAGFPHSDGFPAAIPDWDVQY
jgi:hypothetical protein